MPCALAHSRTSVVFSPAAVPRRLPRAGVARTVARLRSWGVLAVGNLPSALARPGRRQEGRLTGAAGRCLCSKTIRRQQVRAGSATGMELPRRVSRIWTTPSAGVLSVRGRSSSVLSAPSSTGPGTGRQTGGTTTWRVGCAPGRRQPRNDGRSMPPMRRRPRLRAQIARREIRMSMLAWAGFWSTCLNWQNASPRMSASLSCQAMTRGSNSKNSILAAPSAVPGVREPELTVSGAPPRLWPQPAASPQMISGSPPCVPPWRASGPGRAGDGARCSS